MVAWDTKYGNLPYRLALRETKKIETSAIMPLSQIMSQTNDAIRANYAKNTVKSLYQITVFSGGHARN